MHILLFCFYSAIYLICIRAITHIQHLVHLSSLCLYCERKLEHWEKTTSLANKHTVLVLVFFKDFTATGLKIQFVLRVVLVHRPWRQRELKGIHSFVNTASLNLPFRLKAKCCFTCPHGHYGPPDVNFCRLHHCCIHCFHSDLSAPESTYCTCAELWQEMEMCAGSGGG